MTIIVPALVRLDIPMPPKRSSPADIYLRLLQLREWSEISMLQEAQAPLEGRLIRKSGLWSHRVIIPLYVLVLEPLSERGMPPRCTLRSRQTLDCLGSGISKFNVVLPCSHEAFSGRTREFGDEWVNDADAFAFTFPQKIDREPQSVRFGTNWA